MLKLNAIIAYVSYVHHAKHEIVPIFNQRGIIITGKRIPRILIPPIMAPIPTSLRQAPIETGK